MTNWKAVVGRFGGMEVVNAENNTLAFVGPFDAADDVDRAVANLMAAAPDLLAACKLVIGDESIYQDLRNTFAQVIAKAEGKVCEPH